MALLGLGVPPVGLALCPTTHLGAPGACLPLWVGGLPVASVSWPWGEPRPGWGAESFITWTCLCGNDFNSYPVAYFLTDEDGAQGHLRSRMITLRSGPGLRRDPFPLTSEEEVKETEGTRCTPLPVCPSGSLRGLHEAAPRPDAAHLRFLEPSASQPISPRTQLCTGAVCTSCLPST